MAAGSGVADRGLDASLRLQGGRPDRGAARLRHRHGRLPVRRAARHPDPPAGLLGRQPEVGDDISHDGLRFDVLEVDGSRIDRIAVTFEQRRDQKDRDVAERDELEAELFDADN